MLVLNFAAVALLESLTNVQVVLRSIYFSKKLRHVISNARDDKMQTRIIIAKENTLE